MARRIFESCLLSGTQESGLSCFAFSPSQAGFRRGFSTVSHLAVADAAARHGLRYAAFLDFKAAFDSVPFELALVKLQQRQFPTLILRLFASLLFNRPRCSLVVNGASGPFITRTRGIFQGSVISPFLFACFVDDFVPPSPDPLWPEVLLYADDIKLQTSSSQRLQALLDLASVWSQDNMLEFNLAKCQIQAPTLPAISFVPAPFLEYHLGNQVVPQGTSYTYLGVEHTTSGLD